MILGIHHFKKPLIMTIQFSMCFSRLCIRIMSIQIYFRDIIPIEKDYDLIRK